MRRYPLAGLVALTATLSSSCSATVGGRAAWQIAPESLRSPAPANSAQPQLSVSNRGVLLSWIEPSGVIVAHWLQKSDPDTYAYDVRLSYSKDDGRTWSPSVVPHQDGTRTEHGFASLFPMRDGVGLVWLDGRDMKRPTTRPGEHSAPRSEQAADQGSGAMSVGLTRYDRNWKLVDEAAVDERVCECCPTSAIAGIAGNRTSGYPRAAMARNELVFAWVESADGGALQVHTATAAPPAAGATSQ